MTPSQLLAASVSQQAQWVQSGEVKAIELVEASLAAITNLDGKLGSFLHVAAEQARASAALVDQKRASGAALGTLAGVPIALKDSLVTDGMPTTAGSKILKGWLPPYDATVVTKLKAADAIIIGKTNLDEFCMGSSTENSAYHPTRNPWNERCVPGGSSGGSAAAVAARLCSAALGSDTGGSIRQPAAFCGLVGVKPTYGRVSRWGLVAYASSLDQIGPLARTVEDAALLLQVIAGKDSKDATSLDAPVDLDPTRLRLQARSAGGPASPISLAGKRIGMPREYFPAGGGLDSDIRNTMGGVIAALIDAGAEIVEVSLPHTHLALPAYYLLAPAEASSNLARYDGVRFGYRSSNGANLTEMGELTRSEGFGPEVIRRIMLGTFALRAGYYDAYYRRAQQVRTLIKQDFENVFAAGVDALLTPTTPTPAFEIGATKSPMQMYLADVFTLSCNLAGIPGVSVPCGLSSSGLPIGAQLLGRPLAEQTLLEIASTIERGCPLTGAPTIRADREGVL